MPTTRRTYVCRIQNHSQVAGALDRHGWSASKLWNVANYYARQQWVETGEIPDEGELKRELKTHPKYKGLHSQSSQKVLEELSEAFSSWLGSDDNRDNPPGYRKRNYYDSDGNRVHEEHPRSTVTWKRKGIRHDTEHDRIRLSKGKNHKKRTRFHPLRIPHPTGSRDRDRSAGTRCLQCRKRPVGVARRLRGRNRRRVTWREHSWRRSRYL